MDSNPLSLINYENPPLIEVVCGILFRPLKSFLAPHLGLFWNKFKSEYPVSKEVPPVIPIIETFPPGQVKEELQISDTPPLPRVWFINKNETEIIQIQRDRLMHNWKKNRPEDEYPRYYKVIDNFQRFLKQFEMFLNENELGSIVPLQFELTYVNHIPQGEAWEKLSDIGKLFPDFSFRKKVGRFLPGPELINWRLSFPFPNEAGRLHVTIRHIPFKKTDKPIISLELSTRGMMPQDLRKWFDLAHEWIVYGFADLTAMEVQKRVWKRID